MRAGQLRHRLEIQTKSGTQDTYGQPAEDWTTQATVWGSVEPLLGRERFTAQQTQAEVTHRIRIRHRDLTAKSRIKFGSRYFEIIEILNPKERNVELSLLAKEEIE